MRKSQKFWMAIYIVALIIIGFISLPVLGLILAGGSFVALGVIMDGSSDENASWIYLMPLIWFIFLVGMIGLFIHSLYEKTIKKFNDKMDNNG